MKICTMESKKVTLKLVFIKIYNKGIKKNTNNNTAER